MSKTLVRPTVDERIEILQEDWDERRKSAQELIKVYQDIWSIADKERDSFINIMQDHWAGKGYAEQTVKGGGIVIKYGSMDTEIVFKILDHGLFNLAVKEIRRIINRQADERNIPHPSKITWNMGSCCKTNEDLAIACFSIEVDDERWTSTYNAPIWTKCYNISVHFHPDSPPDFMVKDPEKPGNCGWAKPTTRTYTPTVKWECIHDNP